MSGFGAKISLLVRYILENRWTLLTITIACVMLWMIGRNVAHAIMIRYDIAVLESERQHYQERVTIDSTTIENLRYDQELERYAREKYHMQRSNEQIFIVGGDD